MATLKKNTLESQNAFFEKIKSSLAPNISLANDLSDILEVSTDGAYRRLRGETELTMTEFLKLCKHYRLSPESLSISNSNVVSFNYNVLSRNEKNFEQYLGTILNDLVQVSKIPNSQITFTAEDTPIFHYFNYPNLTAFKLFYWNKAIVNVPSLEGKKFHTDYISNELKDTAKKIFETYVHINSVEIWSEHTIVSVLKQIQFFWESGNFKSKEDALQVCDELHQMLNYVEKAAELNSKYLRSESNLANEGNFTMYHSDVMIGNNVIYVKAGEMKKVYMSYNTFNSMSTTNNGFCQEIEEWIKNLTRKSVLVSGVSEKHRFQFFNEIYTQLDALQKKITH